MRLFGARLHALSALVGRRREAQEFPSGTVRLLVPFAAGGPTDVVARILADLLSARWGGKTVWSRTARAPDDRDDRGGRQGAAGRPDARASPPTRC